jgi:NADH-quinone oxidoreductase subunit E
MGAQTWKMHEAQEEFRAERGSLIPMLQRVQEGLGYISEEALQQVAKHLGLTESQVYGVASFYAQFRFTPPGRHSISVCLGTACHVRGGQRLMEIVQRDLGTSAGASTSDGRFDLNRVACLGCCALSPVVKIDHDIYSNVTTTKIRGILNEYE